MLPSTPGDPLERRGEDGLGRIAPYVADSHELSPQCSQSGFVDLGSKPQTRISVHYGVLGRAGVLMRYIHDSITGGVFQDVPVRFFDGADECLNSLVVALDESCSSIDRSARDIRGCFAKQYLVPLQFGDADMRFLEDSAVDLLCLECGYRRPTCQLDEIKLGLRLSGLAGKSDYRLTSGRDPCYAFTPKIRILLDWRFLVNDQH